MKNIAAFALCGFSFFALVSGAQASDQASAPAVTEYTYGTKLDIAKVVNVSDSSAVDNVCEVVPANMTYIDHQGQRHTIEYRVMSGACAQS